MDDAEQLNPTPTEDSENLTFEEEVARAELLLKSSKRKRKALANNNNDNSNHKTQIDSKEIIKKLNKNPLVPIAIVLIIVASAIGILLYLTNFKEIDSLGFTYEELQQRYVETPAYQQVFANFTCELPDVQLQKGDIKNEYHKELEFFYGIVDNNFTQLNIGIQGSCRKSDKQISAIRFLFEAPTKLEDQTDGLTTIFLYFEMCFNAICPELSMDEIDTLLQETVDSNEFETYKNVSYRLTRQIIDGKEYYVLDFTSSKDVSKLAS